MKTISPDMQAIVESGQYLQVDLWQVTIRNYGNPITYYFTAGDFTLTAAPYTAAGFGTPNTYVKGLALIRDRISIRRGTQSNPSRLTVVPLLDNVGGAIQIAGGNFLAQANAGVLDGSVWLMLDGVFAYPGSPPMTSSLGHVYTPPPLGAQVDTSPGIVPYWGGVMSECDAGRFMAEVTIDEVTSLLADIQMPRNVIQPPCLHTFCDSGCTLSVSQNSVTGTVTGVSGNTVTTSLSSASYADGDFGPDGILSFTSGALNGVSFRTQASGHVGGNVTITTSLPLPTAPAIGDAISALFACDKSKKKCASGRFILAGGSPGSNLPHFRAYPYVPNPETLYDGGSGAPASSTMGGQGRAGAGSSFTGIR